MSRNLHPQKGARYLLERMSESADGGARATYRAQIFTPDAVFTATAQLAEDGTFELPATGAPAELDRQLASLTKLIARDAAKRRADGLPTWPLQILRWRE